jgi:hypothetical protein
LDADNYVKAGSNALKGVCRDSNRRGRVKGLGARPMRLLGRCISFDGIDALLSIGR